MPVSGLILTFTSDTQQRRAAIETLRRHKNIELGEGRGVRYPIVVDTPDSDSDREVWQWLHELNGVVFVDLVSVFFEGDNDREQDEQPCGKPPGASRSHHDMRNKAAVQP